MWGKLHKSWYIFWGINNSPSVCCEILGLKLVFKWNNVTYLEWKCLYSGTANTTSEMWRGAPTRHVQYIVNLYKLVIFYDVVFRSVVYIIRWSLANSSVLIANVCETTKMKWPLTTEGFSSWLLATCLQLVVNHRWGADRP